MAEDDRTLDVQTKKRNFRKLLVFVSPYRRRLIVGLALTVFLAVIGMMPPLIVKYIVDRIIVGGNWNMLVVMLGISLLIPLLLAGLRIANTYTVAYVSHRLIMDIRLGMYKYLLDLPMAFHERMGTGKIMSRIMGDVATVRSMVTMRTLRLVTDFVTFWVAMGLCFSLNWKLGMVLLVLLPLYLIVYKVFIEGIRSSRRLWRSKMDDISRGLQERLSGVHLVKSYGQERRENRAFVSETREGLDFAMQTAVYRASSESGMIAVGGLRNTLVFVLGCYFVIQGSMTYGAVMAFQAYAMRMFQPVLNLTNLATQFEQMMVSVDRIFDILDHPVEIADRPDAVEMPPIRGQVTFDRVWFEYEPGEPVLKEVCLNVEPGTMVALVGHTGCGKTTLTSLLMRFYDVTSGAIAVDGFDIRDVTQKSLRRQCGQVLQDSVMFNASIAENLRYGRPGARPDELIEAARIAEIHEFIMRTPDGYDTMLGDEGIKLSVGEKQRLAIARAVLTDPAILILDEATAALDSLSEALIQKAMANVMAGRTAFVIAHRLSTIVNADLIVVMDHGEIVEMGTHESLLTYPDGKYRQLYEEQYAGITSEAITGS